jgi:hypothetical protein
MVGSMDGINGVGTNYSSFVPSCCSAKSVYLINTWSFRTTVLAAPVRIQNLRFAQFLCDAQELSRLMGGGA